MAFSRGAEGAPRVLRIATYNIYKGNWFDRPSPRGGTVLGDFAGLEALRGTDVLALQEAFVGPLNGDRSH